MMQPMPTTSSTFLVTCRSPKEDFQVPVSLDDTVVDLKVKMYAVGRHFYPSVSSLIYNGKHMESDRTLRYYNVTPNSIIHSLLRLRGGGAAPVTESTEDLSGIHVKKPQLQGFEEPQAAAASGGTEEDHPKVLSLLRVTGRRLTQLLTAKEVKVPEEEKSCHCVREELQEVMPETDPHVLEETILYKVSLPGPGVFQCSETGLGFEVESAVSIVYSYATWTTHLSKDDQKKWEPVGPLFNIWALPGAVRAVRLPHFICLADVDISECAIAHFEFQMMTIQKPTKVMDFSAVLENPSFSLLGVVWRRLRSTVSLPMHSLVLIFQQLCAANTTLHLYLIPDDRSVKKAIEKQEMRWNSKLIPKPPPFSPLFFGCRYQVSSTSHVEITPEPHLPFCYKSPKEQQLFVEIYFRNMKEEIEFLMTDRRNDTVVWKALLRPGDISPSKGVPRISSGAAFLKKHKTELCSRMGQLSTILLHLRATDVINSDEEQEVEARNTRQKKNQFLLDLVEKKGLKAQEKFLRILQEKDPFLIEHLENS